MGIRALKATPQYTAFRRWRSRFRDRLRRLWRKLDAWTGAHRLQRTTLAALLASDETRLQELASLVAQQRAQGEARQLEHQAVLAALESLDQRVAALERSVVALGKHPLP